LLVGIKSRITAQKTDMLKSAAGHSLAFYFTLCVVCWFGKLCDNPTREILLDMRIVWNGWREYERLKDILQKGIRQVI